MKTMINEIKFKSQICTSAEQSKRLLELGLKPETADMELIYNIFINTYEPLSKAFPTANKCEIPAWSLHRLIEICNKTQFGIISIYNNEVTVDGALFDVSDNTYDNLISAIECLIKEDYFNKEYLKQ